MRRPLLSAVALLAACVRPEPGLDTPLTDIPETAAFRIEGLGSTSFIVYDAYGTPYVYADDPYDAAALQGFAAARDRFLQVDLSRRLGSATLSALVGDLALDADIEAIQFGARHITANVLTSVSPGAYLELEAYARGVNAYIQAVRDGDLPAPSEYELLAGLLGHDDVADMLEPFAAEDVAAVISALTFSAGFSNREIGWTRAVAEIAGRADGAPFADLREAGMYDDVWGRVHPVLGYSSAPGWDDAPRRRSARTRRPEVLPMPPEILDRGIERFARWEALLGRDPLDGWGSNAWAMAGVSTEDGAPLLAGDGHLDLSAPTFVWAIGIDTRHLSGGDGYKSYGLTSPGVPLVAAGTNGYVAWSSTQPFADINDHYREVIRLGPDGAPAETLFQGTWRPMTATSETVVVADVPFLGSVGRTETVVRYETFDGRWLLDIEGRVVGPDHTPADGETIVRVGGRRIVPEDTDGDGEIVGLTFDFTGLDDRAFASMFDVRDARTVEDFVEVLAHTAAVSQNFIVADHTGSVLYTQFQAMPCRGYLDRDADGGFAVGANPRYILDGTRYGGFTIPFDDGGRLAFGDPDPYRCVIRPEDYPHVVDPAQGFVVSANNDPGGLSADNDLENDRVYIGGPWEDDFRAVRIHERLAALAEDASGSMAAMADIQADHRSNLGHTFAPTMLAAIARGRDLAAADRDLAPHERRIADAYLADADRFDEVEARLQAWADGGYDTPSGVDTDHDPLQEGDEANAVATTIFATWLPRAMAHAWDDEGIPPGLFGTITGATGRTRMFKWMLDGRGPGNPLGLSSYNPETEESVFWDRRDTEPVETSDEILLDALTDALDRLTAPPTEDGKGGFGTDDMDAWLWGYRHWVVFPSLLLSAFGDGGQLGALASQFSLTPDDLPVAAGAPPTDPRNALPGWPRHGDGLCVDSGNPGWSAYDYSYDFGPAFRLVVALDGDGEVRARNVLPGGSSGIVTDPHWKDQAPLWLANEAIDVLWSLEDVLAGAVERHTFHPTGGAAYWE